MIERRVIPSSPGIDRPGAGPSRRRPSFHPSARRRRHGSSYRISHNTVTISYNIVTRTAFCAYTGVMPVPARRDFRGLGLRRKRAARLFAAGKMILASIARELKVSRQSVTRWYREWRKGGASALRGAGRAGRKPQLEQRQLRELDRALRQGARAQDRKSTRLNSSHRSLSRMPSSA